MEEEKFEIKLLVGGTYYPLTIDRKDEALYREAARRINEKLGRYREKYPQLSEEKYYVMTAVHISLLNIMLEQLHDTSPYKDRVEKLSGKLEDFLSNCGKVSEDPQQ